MTKLIGYLNWDHKFRFFRLVDEWNYILKGKFFQLKEFDHPFLVPQKYDVVLVDLLVRGDKELILYSGTVLNFKMKEGDVESIIVTDVIRKSPKSKSSGENENQSIQNTEENSPDYISMSELGSFMIFPVKEVLNYNFHYWNADDTKLEIEDTYFDLMEKYIPADGEDLDSKKSTEKEMD